MHINLTFGSAILILVALFGAEGYAYFVLL